VQLNFGLLKLELKQHNYQLKEKLDLFLIKITNPPIQFYVVKGVDISIDLVMNGFMAHQELPENFEWDIQLSAIGRKKLGWASRDGKHINVSLKGRITHD
jgi:hypothetical protein